MGTDLLFMLKDFPPKSLYSLDWPDDVKLIGVDPPDSLKCGGVDALCSTAYTNTYNWLKDSDGRVLPNFLRHYAPGITPGRIAFLGFSAAHGFLDPLATNQADREMISAYLLMDATFGGGKHGYQAFLEDAAAGDRMLVTTTSNTGGDDGWQTVVKATGITPEPIDGRDPMPVPSGGVFQLGKLGFWYRFVDAKGGTELPHWKMAAVREPMIEAYLIPYWQGKLGGFPWLMAGAAAALAAAGGYAAYRILR